MKITLKKDAACGKTILPKGEYWVSFRPESGDVTFSSDGKDIRFPAKKRRANAKVKTTQISFFCGGGQTWSLVISTPKHGEWVSFIEYTRN